MVQFIITLSLVFVILLFIILNWDYVEEGTYRIGEFLDTQREMFARNSTDAVKVSAALVVVMPIFLASLVIATMVTI